MSIRVILSELRLYLCNHLINKVPSHRIRLFYYRKFMGFVIGKDATIGLGCIFDTPKNLRIGEKSVINPRCRIDSRGGVEIGSCVSISCDTIILTADHDPNNYMVGRNQPVHIAQYVFIGTRAMILAGVSIGTQTVIAAGSVVAKNIPEHSIAGGIPAKVIKPVPNDGVLMKEFKAYKRLFQ